MAHLSDVMMPAHGYVDYRLLLRFTIVTLVGYNFVGVVLLVGGEVPDAVRRCHGDYAVRGDYVAAVRLASSPLRGLNPAYLALWSVGAGRAAWQMLTSAHKWE
ncbi:hypothetical protein [Pseudarthrobacter equi]|uniref:hypothetical protein n=1 Tax=Pseudarthrobacter equi TaxID=728066 RepID=UPI0012FD43D6|nr:hypothetical protein [Pseudarthrobacter equi]